MRTLLKYKWLVLIAWMIGIGLVVLTATAPNISQLVREKDQTEATIVILGLLLYSIFILPFDPCNGKNLWQTNWWPFKRLEEIMMQGLSRK